MKNPSLRDLRIQLWTFLKGASKYQALRKKSEKRTSMQSAGTRSARQGERSKHRSEELVHKEGLATSVRQGRASTCRTKDLILRSQESHTGWPTG